MSPQPDGESSPSPAVLWWVGVGLWAAGTVLAVSTGREVGFAWAEEDYLDHLDLLEGWLSALWNQGLTSVVADQTDLVWTRLRYWNPHPPGPKWAAILLRHLVPGLGFPSAERLFSGLCYGGLAAVAWWMVAARAGASAGAVAAAAVALSPRVLGHAQFLTHDVPLLFFWLAGMAAQERHAATRSPRWFLLATASVVLATACKINGILLLVPWAVLLAWSGQGGWRGRVQDALGLLAAALWAVLTLAVVFPLTWPDPLGMVVDLFDEARQRAKLLPFSAYYLGQYARSTELPWHFVVVIPLVCVPVQTVGAAVLGALSRAPVGLWRACMVHAGFMVLLYLRPNTPRYDNDRQLLVLFPVLGVMAALGFTRALAVVRPRAGAVPAAAALLCGSLVYSLSAALPLPLSAYSFLVGGLPGAVAHGFEPTYYMEALTPGILEEAQRLLPQDAALTTYPNQNLAFFLKRRGYLRADVRPTYYVGPYHLVVHRHPPPGSPMETALTKGRLLAQWQVDGVTVVSLHFTRMELE